MVAAKVTAPRGWRIEGATMHDDASCSAPGDGLIWRAVSPDGAYGKEVTTGNLIKYSSAGVEGIDEGMRQHGCMTYGSTSAEGFLRDVWAPRLRPGWRVTEATAAPPEVLQSFTQKAGPLPPGSEITLGKIKLSGTENGRAYDEQVSAIVRCDRTVNAGARGTTVRTTACVPFLIQAERSPPGGVDAFDAGVANQINGQDNPAYQQRIAASLPTRSQAQFRRLQAQYASENAATTARINGDRQAQLAQGQANLDMIHRTGAAIMNNERTSSDALHQSSQAFARSMGDQAEFTTPGGQTFTGSNQYSHTYVDGQGHAVQTNSAYAPGPGWTETQGR